MNSTEPISTNSVGSVVFFKVNLLAVSLSSQILISVYGPSSVTNSSIAQTLSSSATEAVLVDVVFNVRNIFWGGLVGQHTKIISPLCVDFNLVSSEAVHGNTVVYS